MLLKQHPVRTKARRAQKNVPFKCAPTTTHSVDHYYYFSDRFHTSTFHTLMEKPSIKSACVFDLGHIKEFMLKICIVIRVRKIYYYK